MPNVLSLFPFVCSWNFKLLKPPSLLKNKKHLVGILPRLQQAYVHLKIHSEEKFAWEPDSSFKREMQKAPEANIPWDAFNRAQLESWWFWPGEDMIETATLSCGFQRTADIHICL